MLLLGVVTVGCGSPSGTQETPSIAAASPSTLAAEQQASDAALTAYHGYRRAFTDLQHTAEYTNVAELAKYTADPAKANAIYTLSQMANSGVVSTGAPTSAASVTSVDIGGGTRSVTLADCLDNTGTDMIDRSGKSVLVPGQSRRNKITVKVVQYDDGRWLVQQVDIDRSTTC